MFRYVPLTSCVRCSTCKLANCPLMKYYSLNLSLSLSLSPSPSPSLSPLSLFALRSGETGGKWSQTGCSVSLWSSFQTECSCDHMTHFAVLIQVRDKEVRTEALDSTHSLSELPHTGWAQVEAVIRVLR